MSDSFLGSVTSLLHFTDDSITDNAFSDYTWQRNNTEISSAGVFGGGCLQLSGNDSYITSTLKQIAPYTGNFCVEAFISITGLPTTSGDAGSYNTIFSFSGTSATTGFSWNLAAYSPSTGSTSGYLRATIGDSSGNFSSGTSIQGSFTYTWGTFYHVAFVKNGTTGTLYINGNSVASGTVPSSFFDATSVGGLSIGNNIVTGNKNYFSGLISEPRVTSVERYVSNFTPDTTYYESPITYTKGYPINQDFTSGVPSNFASFYNNTLSTQGYDSTNHALTISSSSTSSLSMIRCNTIPYSKSFTCSFNVAITSDGTSSPIQKSIHLGLMAKGATSISYGLEHYNNVWKWYSTPGNTPTGTLTYINSTFSDTSAQVPGTITITNNTPVTLMVKVYPISSNSLNVGLSSVEWFMNGLPIFRGVVNDDYYMPTFATNGNNNISIYSIVGDVYTVGASYPYSESFSSSIPIGTGLHFTNSTFTFSETWNSAGNILLDANATTASNTWTINKLDYQPSFTFTANMYISTDGSATKTAGICLMSPNGQHVKITHISNNWTVQLFSNDLTSAFNITNIPVTYDAVTNGDISTPTVSSTQEVIVEYSTYDDFGYLSLKVKGNTILKTFGIPPNVYKPAIFFYGSKVTISSLAATTSSSPPSMVGSSLIGTTTAYSVYGPRYYAGADTVGRLCEVLKTPNTYYYGYDTISGIVFYNNIPLENCKVNLVDIKNGYIVASTYTDASGSFTFTGYNTTEYRFYTTAITSTSQWIVPNSTAGTAPITGFLEGVVTPTLIKLTDETNNAIVKSATSLDYDFLNCVVGRQYNIQYNGMIKSVNTTLDMVKGYISGTVETTICAGSSFAIKCYRSDGPYIGLYSIVGGEYTVPNLDVNSLYDIVLFDLNTILESQLISKRVPTEY